MNMNQFTQKSLEAVQNARDIATQYGSQQIEQPHLLLALVDQEGGFIPQLLTRVGLTVESFRAAARHEVELLPKVSGPGREADRIYIAPGVDKAMNQALAIAGGMKDEFVSVEHLFLALLDTAEGRLKELFRTYRVDREQVMQALAALRERLSKIAGFRCMPLPTNQNDMCWINNWHPNLDCSTVADQTRTEIETRDTMREVLAYLKEAVPVAFRHAYLYDIAPQLGYRCSYRLKGEYVMSANDFAFAKRHDDVIAWHSTICQINDCGPVEIPYRAILPQKVEGLLCPGRHLSADNVAIDWLNLIPQCVGTGQSAGVAAAVAVLDSTTTHGVDVGKVQDILVEQNVPLPRNKKFEEKDPSYRELIEDKQCGLYTNAAKAAAEQCLDAKSFRQDHNYASEEDDGQLV